MSDGIPSAAGQRLPRHLVRPGAARPGRLRGPRRRLGPPPPRPRRARLHRPARPHRAGAARLQPGRGGRGLRARPRAARRGRAQRERAGGQALARDRQRGPADRRGRGPGDRRRAALRRRHAALRDRVLLGRGERGDAPALPLPRPAPRPDEARRSSCAHRVARGDARVPLAARASWRSRRRC